MTRLLLAAGLVGVVCLGSPSTGSDTPATVSLPAPKPVDAFADTVAKLRKPARVMHNLTTLTLDAALAQLRAESGLQVIINEAEYPPDAPTRMGDVKLGRIQEIPPGASVEDALRLILQSASLGQPHGYLVRSGYVEVVPVSVVSRLYASPSDEPVEVRMAVVPVVSGVVKAKPLTAAVEELADAYGQTVVVSPASADAAKLPVTARLANVPFDTAVELLATQAGLWVVRKDRAYLVTAPEDAPKTARGDAALSGAKISR